MAVTKALASRYLNIPFLMHVSSYARNPGNLLYLRSDWKDRFEAYYTGLGRTPRPRTCSQRFVDVPSANQTAMLQAVFPTPIYSLAAEPNLHALLRVACSMSSPDLFGFELDEYRHIRRWTVLECKGRSRRIPTGASAHPDSQPATAAQLALKKEARDAGYAMQQALARTHVGAVRVTRHVASYVHFAQPQGVQQNHPRVLRMTWKDPMAEPETGDRELGKKMIGNFLRDYYAPLFALAEMSRRGNPANARSFRQGKFSLKIAPAVEHAFRVDKPDTWASLLEKLPPLKQLDKTAGRSRAVNEFAGADGVTVHVFP